MCGISLTYLLKEASTAQKITSEVTFKLQHRGQGSAGESTRNTWSMGHTRYPTTGGNGTKDKQPFHFLETNQHPEIHVAHNGQLGGFKHELNEQRQQLTTQGYKFQHNSDSELWVAQLQQSKHTNLDEQVRDAFRNNTGSASIVSIITQAGKDIAVAGRRKGNRPLFVGELASGGRVYSSEDYMLRDIHINGEFLEWNDIKEIPPGTFTLYDGENEESHNIWHKDFQERFDLFEIIYFSSHLSTYKGAQIGRIREGFGERLAQTYTPDVDVVSAVPASGKSAAAGYARASNIPAQEALIRDNYSGRNFILASQQQREDQIQRKFNIDKTYVAGKKVLLVDDSIVRGTTMRQLVKMMRHAGAKEVHAAITSPPVTHPTCYGIDMSTKTEMLAASMSKEQIREYLGLDTLGYLSLEDTYDVIEDKTATKHPPGTLSDEVFTGDYWHTKEYGLPTTTN